MSSTWCRVLRGYTGTSRLLAQRHQLVDGRGTVRVCGDQERLAALAHDPASELGRGRGLAGALQADQHHDRRCTGHAEGAIAGAEHRGQLIVDDLDDLLAGVDALEDLVADRAFLDARDEVLDDLVVDVRLEQRQPHLAHGGIDVGLADPAMAGQLAERVAKSVGKSVKHGTASLAAWWRGGRERLVAVGRAGDRSAPSGRRVRTAEPGPSPALAAKVSNLLKSEPAARSFVVTPAPVDGRFLIG